MQAAVAQLANEAHFDRIGAIMEVSLAVTTAAAEPCRWAATSGKL